MTFPIRCVFFKSNIWFETTSFVQKVNFANFCELTPFIFKQKPATVDFLKNLIGNFSTNIQIVHQTWASNLSETHYSRKTGDLPFTWCRVNHQIAVTNLSWVKLEIIVLVILLCSQCTYTLCVKSVVNPLSLNKH